MDTANTIQKNPVPQTLMFFTLSYVAIFIVNVIAVLVLPQFAHLINLACFIAILTGSIPFSLKKYYQKQCTVMPKADRKKLLLSFFAIFAIPQVLLILLIVMSGLLGAPIPPILLTIILAIMLLILFGLFWWSFHISTKKFERQLLLR